ncbi:MAG TPA: electron transfer flavoprotein subunit alpha/FixB family protein [Burkholderiaceae bacterium]|jgi:electron transfer flavoprotein alpha subunit|nr:electron transfer flavoprotein subunit alpha/FixB family protein [Burkholderiaceae bacterium]
MIRRSERRPHRDSGVIRRDPRRERDPGAGPAAARPARLPAQTVQAAQVTIEQPESIVIAVPDLDRGRLTARDRDLIGAARVLADAHRGAVLAVVPSDCTDDLGGAGADRVARYALPAAGTYLPAVLAPALIELAHRHGASHLVFGEGLGGGADVGRRVAAQLGVRPAVRVTSLTAGQAVSLADAGRREILRAPALVLLVEAGCAEPVSGARHQAARLPELALGREPAIIDLGLVKVDRSAVPLVEAELIISAGAGVSDWDAFHRLASRLGAAEGASRVVCDLGHLPRDRQIGASGAVVEPRGYLAFGISGAPQHLQGIARCERVVAVNSDPHAPMMLRADLAIVADVQQVMPALTDLIERERPGA